MIRCAQFTWEFATQSKRFPRLQTNCDLFGFLFEKIHSRSPAGLLWSTYTSVTLVQYLTTSRSCRSAITTEAPGHSQKVTCDLFGPWRLHSHMVTNCWAYRRADPIQYTISYFLRMNSRPEFCVSGFLKSRGPVYEFLMSGVQICSFSDVMFTSLSSRLSSSTLMSSSDPSSLSLSSGGLQYLLVRCWFDPHTVTPTCTELIKDELMENDISIKHHETTFQNLLDMSIIFFNSTHIITQERQQEVIVSSYDVIIMNHHGCNCQSSLDSLPPPAAVILLFCA
jgi:hypothetical protein